MYLHIREIYIVQDQLSMSVFRDLFVMDTSKIIPYAPGDCEAWRWLSRNYSSGKVSCTGITLPMQG